MPGNYIQTPVTVNAAGTAVVQTPGSYALQISNVSVQVNDTVNRILFQFSSDGFGNSELFMNGTDVLFFDGANFNLNINKILNQPDATPIFQAGNFIDTAGHAFLNRANGQQATPGAANGTLADVTAKFNLLVTALLNLGLIA